ncbi:MAG: DegV family protein [Eubacteriales bacterium]|nr:DegV family protein [Eubacteriales bacterium]
MGKVAIVTDSSCMTIEEAKKLGVYLLPMSFTIDGEEYFEGLDMSAEFFYEKLASDAEMFTSQPAAGAVMDLWDQVLEEYDELVHIPISSGLSGSYGNACIYAQDYDGKVEVADVKRISVPMRAAVEDAVTLRDQGLSAKEIRDIITGENENSVVFIAVDNLDRLKKGGRITPMAAAIGNVLKIRPILKYNGKSLDGFAKVRSLKKAKQTIIQALESSMRDMDVHTPSEVRIQAACTFGYEGKDEWVADLKAAFPEFEIEYGDLPMNLSCHIGTGGVGGAITKRLSK